METSTTSRSKAPIMGIILVALAAIVVAVVVGVAAAAIKTYLGIYLIIVFPLVMAFVLAWTINKVAKIGKLRSGGAVVVLAVLAGLLMYGTYRYAEYVFFKQQLYQTTLTQVTIKAGKPLTADQINKFNTAFDSELQKDETVGTFLGFVQATAKEGVGIHFGNSATNTSGGLNFTLSEPLTWVYWALEILAICGVAAASANKGAKDLFCEKDNRFFATQNLGRVDKASADQFMALAKAGDWHGANALIDSSKSKPVYPYLAVSLQKCPACNTNSIPLKVVRKLSSKSSTDKIVLNTTLSPVQYDSMTGSATIPGGLPA